MTASEAGVPADPLDQLQPWELERVLQALRVVAAQTGVEPPVMLGRQRTYQASQARHLAMHAIRHHAGLSYARLAQIFGVLGTTAFGAVRDVNYRQREDAGLRAHLNAIRAELAS